jgi:DNA-binding LytR/AlgR family response regulator
MDDGSSAASCGTARPLPQPLRKGRELTTSLTPELDVPDLHLAQHQQLRLVPTPALRRTAAEATTNPHWMAIRTAQGMLLVSLDDVEWIEARGDYVRVHSAGRVDLVRETISGFERRSRRRGSSGSIGRPSSASPR